MWAHLWQVQGVEQRLGAGGWGLGPGLPVAEFPQLPDHALSFHLVQQLLVLPLGAIADVDVVRLTQPDAALHESSYRLGQAVKGALDDFG